VTNFGPACIADAIFSASDFDLPDGGACAYVTTAVISTKKANFFIKILLGT
jgi:hypothetical protein